MSEPVMQLPYASPLEAKCRHCDGHFYLYEVVDARDGLCPRCTWPLAPDWQSVLLAQAAQAERSQQQLVRALRRLVGLPGNLELLPHSVLRSLFEEVGWEEKLRHDPALIREELRTLGDELRGWEALLPRSRQSAIPSRMRRLAELLRRFGGELDDRRETSGEAADLPTGDQARRAAAGLDAAAASLEKGMAENRELAHRVDGAGDAVASAALSAPLAKGRPPGQAGTAWH